MKLHRLLAAAMLPTMILMPALGCSSEPDCDGVLDAICERACDCSEFESCDLIAPRFASSGTFDTCRLEIEFFGIVTPDGETPHVPGQRCEAALGTEALARCAADLDSAPCAASDEVTTPPSCAFLWD